MTPTVQRLHSEDRASAWAWFFIGQAIGIVFFIYTGWWVFIIVNAFFSWLEFQSVGMKHRKRLFMEMEIAIQIKTVGWNTTRMALVEFEEEAEHNTNRLEQFRQRKFADEFRSIMEDVKKEIDKHELKQN